MATDENYNHLVARHWEKVKLMESSGFLWKAAEGREGRFVLASKHRRDVLSFETVCSLSTRALQEYLRLVHRER